MAEEQAQFDSTPGITVGVCRVCGTGPLGLRTCGDCGAIAIVCDECDAAWAEVTLEQPPSTLGATTLPCPHCQSDLFEEPAHWTSSEELGQTAWLTNAAREGRITLHYAKTEGQEPAGD